MTDQDDKYVIVNAPVALGIKLMEALDGNYDIFLDDDPSAKSRSFTFSLKPEAEEVFEQFASHAHGGFTTRNSTRTSNATDQIFNLSMQEYIKLGMLVFVFLGQYAETTSWEAADRLLHEFLSDVETGTLARRSLHTTH